MDDVKRYNCTNGKARFCYGCYEMTEDSDGNYVQSSDFDAALAREAELREELAKYRILAADQGLNLTRVKREFDASQQRLTAAEQRNVELWKLAEFAYDHEEIDGAWVEDYRRLKLLEAKPTESGASE